MFYEISFNQLRDYVAIIWGSGRIAVMGAGQGVWPKKLFMVHMTWSTGCRTSPPPRGGVSQHLPIFAWNMPVFSLAQYLHVGNAFISKTFFGLSNGVGHFWVDREKMRKIWIWKFFLKISNFFFLFFDFLAKIFGSSSQLSTPGRFHFMKFFVRQLWEKNVSWFQLFVYIFQKKIKCFQILLWLG